MVPSLAKGSHATGARSYSDPNAYEMSTEPRADPENLDQLLDDTTVDALLTGDLGPGGCPEGLEPVEVLTRAARQPARQRPTTRRRAWAGGDGFSVET